MGNRKDSLKYNASGCYDPTAYYAMKSLITEQSKEAKKVHRLINQLKEFAESQGYEVVGRITLKNKHTRKVFK